MPELVRPHKRLRALREGAKEDLESHSHTKSEHQSNGKGSYRKIHPLPRHVRKAESNRFDSVDSGYIHLWRVNVMSRVNVSLGRRCFSVSRSPSVPDR